MNSLTEISTPLVITSAMRGLELRSVVGREARILAPHARLPLPRPGTDEEAQTEDRVALSADGVLVPKQLYPSAAASEDNVRYYVPDYAPRMEQGRHTSSLRFRASTDDPNGPLGWLTIEMAADRPQDPAFEMKEIGHEVQLRLGHRLTVAGVTDAEAGTILWISLGPLVLANGIGVCRYPFHAREEFDDLFQILTEASRNGVLQLEYRATIAQRSWNQILAGTLWNTELKHAFGIKRFQLNPESIRLMRSSAADAVNPAGVQRAAALKVAATNSGLQARALRIRPWDEVLDLPPEVVVDPPPLVEPVPTQHPEPLADGCAAFEYAVPASAIEGSRALLDHPQLNGRRQAVVLATPIWESPGPYHPHPISLRLREQRWTIENLDQKPFPRNSRFNFLVVSDPGQLSSRSGGRFRAYVHTVTSQNLNRPGGHISNLEQSRDRDAALILTQVIGGAGNVHHVGTWFNPSGQCQSVYNEDREALPAGSQFHVLEFKAGGFPGLHLHVASAANTRGHVTTIDHPLANGNRRVIVLACHDYGPSGPYVPHPIGVWYDGSRWTIFTQDIRPMPAGARFRVVILARDAANRPGGSSGDPGEILVDPGGEPVLVRKEVTALREFRPFTFPLDAHSYMFDVPSDPVKNRVFFPHTIPVPGEGDVTFYQDSLFRERVYYEPKEFRLTRHSTEPYGPSIVFAFSPVVGTTNGSGPEAEGKPGFDVRLAYRAVPFLPPQVLLQARQKFGPETAFAALMPATTSLKLRLPEAEGAGSVEIEREGATISFEEGITDEFSLPQAQFERIFAKFLEPGSVGLQGTLRATLSDGTPAEIEVRLSLRESAGDVFDRTFRGPVAGSPGIYLVELKNRIESPVLIREVFAVPIGREVTAFPHGPVPPGAVPPGETIGLQYRVTPESAAVLDLEPSMGIEIDLDLPIVHRNITLNELPSDKTRTVRVSIDPIFFETAPAGKSPLVSAKVSFDSGVEVGLTREAPSANAALVVPFLIRIMLREGEEKDFTYGYAVTLTFADSTSEVAGPFTGIGNLEITPGAQ